MLIDEKTNFVRVIHSYLVHEVEIKNHLKAFGMLPRIVHYPSTCYKMTKLWYLGFHLL